jgi:hypothetical protein
MVNMSHFTYPKYCKEPWNKRKMSIFYQIATHMYMVYFLQVIAKWRNGAKWDHTGGQLTTLVGPTTSSILL